MKGVFVENFGNLGLVISAGIIILLLFIVLRFFKTLFSMSFIGFVLSLVSYSVYEYIFIKVPVLACIGFVLCITGFSKSSIVGKIFAIIGMVLSIYIIGNTLGLL